MKQAGQKRTDPVGRPPQEVPEGSHPQRQEADGGAGAGAGGAAGREFNGDRVPVCDAEEVLEGVPGQPHGCECPRPLRLKAVNVISFVIQ